MEIRENLELIEVKYENDSKKAILTFLDTERGEIRENEALFKCTKPSGVPRGRSHLQFP